ncbi:uncharacterized protein PAC_08285 [Phialocephala subalpina]|uniref:FAD-binding FR-type domain-containing protein n=1 Tax=Phialocephala subalpina TaxID=576137 RepID=A0A1L7X046_9HELO|nr:uncharacterized protein PAC_08285 [Phialocephala subalpina]
MSTSQSSQSTQAGPAGIIWSRFPPEVQFKILTWIHVSGKLLSTPTIYLLVACCIWTLLHLLQICQMLYRNVRNWKYSCKVAIESLPDAYQVHAKISRPWKYRAGQYIYLCIPGVSYSAISQSHPYMVSWWYKYDKDQDIMVFIIQRQRGFTRSLPTSNSSTRPTELRAIIEGPYGKEIHLDEYGTVLLFATGIGIAGQLPYMRQLLENFHNYDAKARRIALFWQVESEGQWMTDLLEQDSEYILDIRLFVVGNYITKGAEHGMVGRISTHDRIIVNYRGLDVENLIRSELEGRKGQSVVSLCVNYHIGEQVREVVRQMLDKDIQLKELPFHPL